MTLDSVERRVIPGGDTHTVVLARDYDTSVDDLWDACTNPDRLPRWFLPISGELRLGGRYQLEGNAGGTIERCPDDERWTEFGPGAVGVGWDSALGALGRYLDSGRDVDPAAAAKWAASDAGRGFLRAVNERWRDASIAGGTDPADAQAAADRTTAFYTPEPSTTG